MIFKQRAVPIAMLLFLSITIPGIAQEKADIKKSVAMAEQRNSSGMETINVSAETFSVAVIKALIKMNDLAEIKGEPVEIEATDDTGDTAAFDTASSVSNQSYGNIKVTSLEKVFEEEHSGNDSERKSTFFTQTLAAEILFSNEDGNLLIKHFEEEVNGRKNSNLSVTSEGITFSDLIRELTTMGVEIEQQTIPTESYVTLKVPRELLIQK